MMEESPIFGKKINFRKRNNITPLIMVDIENVSHCLATFSLTLTFHSGCSEVSCTKIISYKLFENFKKNVRYCEQYESSCICIVTEITHCNDIFQEIFQEFLEKQFSVE